MAKPTPSQTVGPFFARDLLWKDGGTVLFPGRSDRITLTGRVFDGDGAPIHDALFETWQADPTGAFPSSHDGARPHGYGRVSNRASWIGAPSPSNTRPVGLMQSLLCGMARCRRPSRAGRARTDRRYCEGVGFGHGQIPIGVARGPRGAVSHRYPSATPSMPCSRSRLATSSGRPASGTLWKIGSIASSGSAGNICVMSRWAYAFRKARSGCAPAAIRTHP